MVSDSPDAAVGVLGVPFDGGVSFRRGAAFAPARLRELSTRLAACGDEGTPLNLDVRDYGDVPPDLNWSRIFQTVEERAAGPLQHAQALFLGGDHSVSIPLMRAFDRSVDGSFGVVILDAHPDLFDVYDGHRWSHACTARRALDLEGLDAEHLIFAGLRSIAREEWDFLQAHPSIRYVTAREWWRSGVDAVAHEVVARLQDVRAVYLSLDIDVLDPAFAPGTGYPEGGGPSTRELLELVRALCGALPIKAMDVVEVAPVLDHGDRTSFAALSVIYEAWSATEERWVEC